MDSGATAVLGTWIFVVLVIISFLSAICIFVCFNPNFSRLGRSTVQLLAFLGRTLDQVCSAMALVYLGQFFQPLSPHLLKVGHTLALSLALVQYLVSRRRSREAVQILRLVSICLVHITPDKSLVVTCFLRLVALLASSVDLMDRMRCSPRQSPTNSHNSLPLSLDEDLDNRSVFSDSLGSCSRSSTRSPSPCRYLLNRSDSVTTGQSERSSPSPAPWSSANWSRPYGRRAWVDGGFAPGQYPNVFLTGPPATKFLRI